MPAWNTSSGTYILPDSLEDINETIVGTMQGLTKLGFGSEITGVTGNISVVAGTQAARDNGDTFVSINFVFLGGKTFAQVVVIYMHGTSSTDQLDALHAQVNNAINNAKNL